MRSRLAILLVLALAAPAAAATLKGPSLGTLEGGRGVVAASGVRFVTTYLPGQTKVRALSTRTGRVLRSATIPGAYGVPVVTHDGSTGGASADGGTLVLADRTGASRFAILDAKTLRVRKTFELPGAFSYDAISPNGRIVFLIEYRTTGDAASYRVRAYDAARARLFKQVVVAKGEAGPMEGDAVTRAESADGAWAYTLYGRTEGEAFVHALSTANRFAVCIDLPWQADRTRLAGVRLSTNAGQLVIARGKTKLATIDLASFKVRAYRKP